MWVELIEDRRICHYCRGDCGAVEGHPKTVLNLAKKLVDDGAIGGQTAEVVRLLLSFKELTADHRKLLNRIVNQAKESKK